MNDARPSRGRSHRGANARKSPKASFDPQRLWQLIKRRRFYLLLPFVVIGVFVGVGLRTITPVFISTSKLMIEERDRLIGNQIDSRLWSLEGQRARDRDRLAVVREKIRSEELLLKVIRNLRLREDPMVLDEATILQQTKLPEQTVTIIAERILVNRLRSKIYVWGGASEIYLVSVEDNDPITAYRLNEAITEAYVEQVERERFDRQIETLNFTDEEFEAARRELETAESELEEFKRSMILDDELGGNPINENNSQRAENLRRLARLDREEAQRELENVRGRLRDRGVQPVPRSTVLQNPDVDNMRQRLVALEREDFLAQLQESASTTGRRATGGLTQERQRIGVARNRLSTQLQELVRQEHPELGDEAAPLMVQMYEFEVLTAVFARHENQIEREYRTYTSRVQAQPAQEAELRRLENAVERAQEVFDTLVNARSTGETTQRAEQFGFGKQVRVIEPPKKPLFPAKPDKIRIAMLASVLALGIGGAAVFLSEYVDSSFKDVDEVEAVVGLEVLGTLPRFAEEFQWEKAKRRKAAMWRVAFAITLLSVMALLLLFFQRSTIQDRIFLVGEVASNPTSVQESRR